MSESETDWAYTSYRNLKRACVRFHLMQYPETDDSICYSCGHMRSKHRKVPPIVKHKDGEVRRVYYCLWNNGKSSSMACQDLHVTECSLDSVAGQSAVEFRNLIRQGKTPFKPSIFVYKSHGSIFGYKVCKTLEPEPNVFVNMFSVNKLDSDRPIMTHNIRKDSVTEDETVPQKTNTKDNNYDY